MFNIYQKMSDSAVLPSISTGTTSTQSATSNTTTTTGLSIAHLPVSLAQSITSLAGLTGKTLVTENESENRGNSPVSNSNTVSLIQAAAASQVALQQQNHQQSTTVNQTDYFRNCNVPNLINKWRRRHTWLFLREGKMFCQACIDFKAVAKRYGRCDERNKFCNEGSTNFRSSAVEDHARSETHLRAVRATQSHPNEDGAANFAAPQETLVGKNNPYDFGSMGPTLVPRPSLIDRTPASGRNTTSQLSMSTPNPNTNDVPFSLAQADNRTTDEKTLNFDSNSPTPDLNAKNSPSVPETSDERIQHLNVMLGKLRQQRAEGILCDVWVRYPNRQIQAHKALLSAASPVLAERLQLDSTKNSVSEIEVSEVKPAIFQQIIDFIYSGEIPTAPGGDTSQLLDAARFLQMKDLIQRLEKFESDLNQLRDFLPNFFQPAKKNRKRSLQKMSMNNNHRVSPSTMNDKIAIKLAPFAQQVTIKTESPSSHDDITIEEIGPCDEETEVSTPPPSKTIKRELQPTEIEVKVSDPTTPIVTPKPSPISGASRRKGASQRIAPSVVMNNDAPIDGVEEWLSNNKDNVKTEIY